MNPIRFVAATLLAVALVLPPGARAWTTYVDGDFDDSGWQGKDSLDFVAVDGANDVYAAGKLATAIDGIWTGIWTDLTVLKLSGETGEIVWRKAPLQIPPANLPCTEDSTTARGLIDAGTGDVILAGGYCDDGMGNKFDHVMRLAGADGSVLWNLAIPRTAGFDVNLQLATDGSDFFVSRVSAGSPLDVYKLNGANGAVVWIYSVPGNPPNSLRAAPTGDVYLQLGSEVIKLAGADGSELWRRSTGTLETVDSAGNPILINDGWTPAQSWFLRKLSGADGSDLWTLTDPGLEGSGIAEVDGNDDIIAAAGDATLYLPPLKVVKVSGADGNILWSWVMDGGGNGPDVPRALRIDSAGDVLLAGSLYYPDGSEFDPELFKIAGSDGSTLWHRRNTDWASHFPTNLVVDSMDSAIAVGHSSILNETAGQDGFVWKVYENGGDTSCYNGTLEFSEQCDDTNRVNGDGCDNNCTVSDCGNGIYAGAEDCDDGNLVNGDGCDNNCTYSACGNNETAPEEQCDDGNTTDGDSCDSDCTTTACGNGIATAGEACDDGNPVNGDTCDNNCTVPACGNGIVTGAEACDDGNLLNGDGCDSNCTIPGCGNGAVTAGEICDDGNLASGDGCDANCRPTACGSGIVTAGEVCDDGNVVDADGCDSNCRPTACGNGAITVGEACDDGNEIDGDGCDSNCSLSSCGNGIRSPQESCDDGNTVDGDGCESDCRFTPIDVAENVGPGETVTTNPTGAVTESAPTQVSVTTPSGGLVEIETTDSGDQLDGYGMLGMLFHITAPPATTADPLQLVLVTDASLIPAGATLGSLAILKNGVAVPDCTGAPQAIPDPCVGLREALPTGDARMTVLTSSASTWAVTAPSHDAVVYPLKPLKVKMPTGTTSLTKKLAVSVGSGDPPPSPPGAGQTIQLAAETSCPGATLSTADFGTKAAGSPNTVTLGAGKKAKAFVMLTVRADAVSGINKNAPFRCNVTLSVRTTAPAGSMDPQPSNDSVVMEVNIFDDNDPGQATSHESLVSSAKALKVTIAPGDLSATKVFKFKLINGDILPSPEVGGHVVTAQVGDGSCPPGTVGAIDVDSKTDGVQSSVLVKGGAVAAGSVALTLHTSGLNGASVKSPSRCAAILSVTGPGGEATESNNSTRILVDLADKNNL